AILERSAIFLPLQKLEQKHPVTFARAASLLDRAFERPENLLGMLQGQRVLALANLRERMSQQLGTGVVGAGQRTEIESHLRLFLRRGEHVFDLRRVRGRELAAERKIASRRRSSSRPRLRSALLPGRSGAFERDDVLEGKLVECSALVQALQQIEQREPRQRRTLRVVVVDHAVLQDLPGL